MNIDGVKSGIYLRGRGPRLPKRSHGRGNAMKKFCLALVLTALLCALLPAALAAGGEGQVSFYDEAAGRYLEPVRTD